MLLLLLCLVSTACTCKPSIEERRTIERLKEELASIKQQLEEAQQEHSAYSDGLIKALIALRLELLKTNEAIVTQRIHALEAGSKITVVVNTTKPDPERASQLTKELETQRTKLAEAQAGANRYAGGLVKAMADTTVATAYNTVVMLEQQYLIAKYGLFITPLPASLASDLATVKAPTPSKPNTPTAKQCLTIDTFDSSELSRNNSFVELTWKVDVKNACDQVLAVQVTFILYDKDEFELDSDRARIQVPENGIGKARGKMLVSPPEKAQRMTRHGVKISSP